MNFPLAVFTPLLGEISETFIQKHVNGILPGQTLVLYRHLSDAWQTDHPSFNVNLDRNRIRFIEFLYKKSTDKVRNFIFSLSHDVSDAGIDQKAVKQLLRRNGVKVIMGEYLDQSLWLIRIAKELGITFYGHAHGYDVSMYPVDSDVARLYQKYNETGGIITMSEISRQTLIRMGIHPSKLFVIPYGLPITTYRKQWESKKEIVCLAVGRLVAKKNPLATLEAFQKALLKNDQLVLHLIGDGELMPSILSFIAQHQLQNRVVIHGAKSNQYVYELMQNADIFLQHSVKDPLTGDEEGLPVAILEAMSHSLPVVATHHAGIPEAVLDGETGFLVPEFDVKAMSNRIIELADSLLLRKQMGIAGYQRFKTRFTWEKEKEQLKKVLGLV